MFIHREILESTGVAVRDYCALIEDTIGQECDSSPRWISVDQRVQKYLGEEGLLRFVKQATKPGLSTAVRIERLLVAIQETRKCRAWALDAVEQAFAPSLRWPMIRGRLLKYFGPRGIEGHLVELLEKFQKGEN